MSRTLPDTTRPTRFQLVHDVFRGFLVRHLGGERADRALSAELRATPQLSAEERRLAAGWTLGIALWRGRLDVMARGDTDLWLPLFLVDREGLHPSEAARQCGVDAALLTRALEAGATFVPEDEAHALAFRRSLPVWLARRWSEQLGTSRADSLAAAMNERGPIAIRANTFRSDRDSLLERLRGEGVSARPGNLAPHSLILEGRPNIVALDAWRAGLFEVQDEGSQLIADAASAGPGQVVVDLCAGSGGKTLALAAAMRNEGRLVAVDVEADRLRDLEVRARRHGFTCVVPRVGDATDSRTIADLHDEADVVLVDAPCSALGTLRRGPDARWRVAPDGPATWSVVQRALLAAAVTVVKPGGRLVYATCSVDPLENEAVAGSIRSDTLLPVLERRVWPDVDGCDGFFWSIWRRSET